MKFFHGRRVQTHIHMKAPKRNKKGDRRLTILFRITLNGDTVRSAPDVVKWGYDGVKTKGEDHVGIKNEVDNLNLEIFKLPDSQKVTLRLKALYLQKLAVKEISSGKGDTSIVLTFQSEYEFEDKVWQWLGENYATDVFLEFDAAQAQLIDIEEEPEGKDEPEQMALETEPASEPANGKAKGGKAASFNIEDFKDSEQAKAVAETPTKKGKDAAVGD